MKKLHLVVVIIFALVLMAGFVFYWNSKGLQSLVLFGRGDENGGISDANGREYFYPDYGITLIVPDNYEIIASTEKFNYSTVTLQNRSTGSNLYLGDFAIFSRSGNLCTEEKCDKYAETSVVVNGEEYVIPVYRRYQDLNQESRDLALSKLYEGDVSVDVPESNWEFKDFVFQIDLPPELSDNRGNLVVTGRYEFEDNLEELLGILSTISW